MLSSSSRSKSNKRKNSKKERDNNNDDEVDKEEQELQERENYNIVRLLEVDSASKSSSGQSFATPPPEFRSHCIFLFEYLPHNLREVLNKFGKDIGINLTAVKSYARQLLCALRHLEKHRIVHADIKPDNILVSQNFSTLKLCDFGSAFFETDHDNDPTPYLVSRFYRPPEVILGLEYDRMVDLWSVGVTLSELYTGSVLFAGNSNNDMLKRFMDTMGAFSFKMVKRHAASYSKMGLEPHFEVGNTGGTYEFRKHDLDKVTGDPIVRIVNVLTAKTEASLSQVLLKASRGSGGVSERVEVLKFANFLNRCLALDPSRRLSVRHALQHDFFMKKKKKEENTT
jgi:serine/threonine-protein kinase PRP4